MYVWYVAVPRGSSSDRPVIFGLVYLGNGVQSRFDGAAEATSATSIRRHPISRAFDFLNPIFRINRCDIPRILRNVQWLQPRQRTCQLPRRGYSQWLSLFLIYLAASGLSWPNQGLSLSLAISSRSRIRNHKPWTMKLLGSGMR
jgi:hypothetical protein